MTPYKGKFSKFCSKRIHCHTDQRVVFKFCEIWQTEIGKIMHCLPNKKTQNFASLSSSHYCADRAQNLPGPAPDSVLRVLQILSKSVHFWQSYIQMCEHHQSVLKSESNIQMKPSFEPNKNKIFTHLLPIFS